MYVHFIYILPRCVSKLTILNVKARNKSVTLVITERGVSHNTNVSISSIITEMTGRARLARRKIEIFQVTK